MTTLLLATALPTDILKFGIPGFAILVLLIMAGLYRKALKNPNGMSTPQIKHFTGAALLITFLVIIAGFIPSSETSKYEHHRLMIKKYVGIDIDNLPELTAKMREYNNAKKALKKYANIDLENDIPKITGDLQKYKDTRDALKKYTNIDLESDIPKITRNLQKFKDIKRNLLNVGIDIDRGELSEIKNNINKVKTLQNENKNLSEHIISKLREESKNGKFYDDVIHDVNLFASPQLKIERVMTAYFITKNEKEEKEAKYNADKLQWTDDKKKLENEIRENKDELTSIRSVFNSFSSTSKNKDESLHENLTRKTVLSEKLKVIFNEYIAVNAKLIQLHETHQILKNNFQKLKVTYQLETEATKKIIEKNEISVKSKDLEILDQGKLIQTHVSSIKKLTEDQTQQINPLNDKVLSLEETNRTLNMEITKIRDDLQESRNNIMILRKENTALIEENKAEKDNLKNSLKLLQTKTTKIIDLTQPNTAAHTENVTISKKYDLEKKENDPIQASLNSRKKEIEKFEIEIKTLTKTNNELIRDVQRLNDIIRQLNEDVPIKSIYSGANDIYWR